ncbi:MAG TPA: glycosyltransferase family 4 protein [Streptosporangiaceae bacterium]|nr:glycosyltransferase family 4 protein [Streptosporangiaceae bacterium]
MADFVYANRKLAVPFARGGDAWDVHEWLLGLSGCQLTASRIALAPDGSPTDVAVTACERFRALSLAATASVSAGRVDVTVSDGTGRSYQLVLVQRAEVPAAVARMLISRPPKFVMTAQDGSDDVAALALAHGVPCFVVINYVEPNEGRLALLADRGCRLVAGSSFLQSHYAPLRPELVEPAIDPVRYSVQAEDGDRVTMINPIPPKGGATFLRLAFRLPEVRFLAVEGWKDMAELFRRHARENLEWAPWHPDVRPALRRTRLLVAPAVWPEAFCRIVVEAQVSGIPAVVSGRGGLPATVGLGGVVVADPEDVDAWVAAVARLWDDSAERSRLAELARINAARFTPQASARSLLALIEADAG